MSGEIESGAALELKPVGDRKILSDGAHMMSNATVEADTPRLDYYDEKEDEDDVRWIKSHVQNKCQHHKYMQPLHTRSKLDDKVIGLNPMCTCGNLRSQHESTDVFGEFQFDNDDNQLARFMKTDDVELLPQLLARSQRRWNSPRKLISVVGGDHNILMSKRSKEILRHGFTDIAEKYERNVCFVTNGVNTTINRLVGESCKNMNLLTGWNGYNKLTPVIGVVPWSNVPNKDQLKDREGKWQFKYSQIYDKNSMNLETNHTDFFFVDDDNEYRVALEREYSIGILLVIRGGTEAFSFIEETIRNGLRIVFIKGFGGVADIMAQVLPLTRDGERQSLLKTLIERGTCLGISCCGEELQRIMNAVENIIIHKQSVAVYDLSSDRSQDFGRFLLYQIEESRYAPGTIKHESPNTGDLRIIEEMRDAIVGGKNSVAIELLESGRYDVNYLKDKDSNFGQRMAKLLSSNNYECLDTFFNNGLKGNQFLSFRVLEDCYKAEGVDVHMLEDTWKEFMDSLKGLGYRWPFVPGSPVDDKMINLEHLFVWSVVFRRHEIAMLIWAELDEPVAAALAVNKIQQLIISIKRIKDTEVLNKYEQYSNEFTDLGIEVIDACYENKIAKYNLRRKLRNWKDQSCLIMASETDNKRFISRIACQEYIRSIWWRNDDLRYSKYSFSRYILYWLSRCCSTEMRDRAKQLSTSPVAKFSFNALSYVIFLILYSYHMLTNFDSQFTVIEGVLCFWVFTLICEECRQFVTSDSVSLTSKLKVYIYDSLNVLDLVTIVLFILGIILRFIPNSDCFEASRVVFCLNLVSFYIRLLRTFVPYKQIGPKLVMINKMIWQDLTPFIIILMVFLVAYSVASEALLYPNTEISWKLIYYLPRKAYWQIYGELFLDNIEGDPECTRDPNSSGDYSKQRCPTEVGKYAGPVFLGIYVLFTNVLLLNLLIAMFSNTFARIQEQSNLYWCSNYFHLVREYDGRPVLPPPLIIIEHIYRILKSIKCLCSRCKKVQSHSDTDDTDTKFKMTLDYKMDNYCGRFERMAAKLCLQKRKEVSVDSSKYVQQWLESNQKELKEALNREKTIHGSLDQGQDTTEDELRALRQEIGASQKKLEVQMQEILNYLSGSSKHNKI